MMLLKTCSCLRQFFRKGLVRNLFVKNFNTTCCKQKPSYYQENLPSHTHIVICGGGIIGTSIAYHLTRLGVTGVVLLEQGALSGGVTWMSSGVVGCLRKAAERQLCILSVEFYRSLHEQGYDIGWHQTGSINLARTENRMISLRRLAGQAKVQKLECSFVTPEEIGHLVPPMKVNDLKGGVYVPNDAIVDPNKLCKTLAKLAEEKGAKIIEGCTVEEVLVESQRVKGVRTNLGTVECETFINSAGMWSREIGQRSNPQVRVPVLPVLHAAVTTKTVSGMELVTSETEIRQAGPITSVIRDYDGAIVFQPLIGGCLQIRGYEANPKLVFTDGIPPAFQFQALPEDWEHFNYLLLRLNYRFPTSGARPAVNMINGPEAFTPDGTWIVGEAPEINNYYLATGFCDGGIAAAGGVGKALAERIVQMEEPRMTDLWSLEITRFFEAHSNLKYLSDRVTEIVGRHYAINYPFLEHRTGRNLRTSTLHTTLKENGAVYIDRMGFERPMWFTDDTELQEKPLKQETFGKPEWFDDVEAEYHACREGVCLIDMSSLSKFELWSRGDEVVKLLQYICANDVDVPPGAIVHTGMLNHHGGYENDCSIVRTAQNRYFMISPTSQLTHSWEWIQKHLPEDNSVMINNVSSKFTVMNLIGPKSNEVLKLLTDADIDKFPYFSYQLIDVGLAGGIKAMHMTHSGEPGWTLYVPNELAVHIYESLMTVGRDYGIINAGYQAVRFLRIEKFHTLWGEDFDRWTTPWETGAIFRVKFQKSTFIGKGALLRQKEQGISRRLVQFHLEGHDMDRDQWPWGGEPIYRNGKYVGLTRSTCYGFTLHRMVCLGAVHDFHPTTRQRQIFPPEFITDPSAKFEIEIGGKRFRATQHLHPPRIPTASQQFNVKYRPKPTVMTKTKSHWTVKK